MTKIISVTNRKGGTGKSTLNIILATALAKEGRKVLLLDCDTQRTVEKLRAVDSVVNKELAAPYDVEGLQPRFIHDYLKTKGSDYDFIFIDLPRFTSVSDSLAMQTLSMCDCVLIPVLGSAIEILSAKDFLNAINELAAFKEKNNIQFKFFGFLNRNTRRKENQKTIEYMDANGLQMFDNSLSDLKLFANPSTFFSILDDKEGKTRFERFYNEFKTKFDII